MNAFPPPLSSSGGSPRISATATTAEDLLSRILGRGSPSTPRPFGDSSARLNYGEPRRASWGTPSSLSRNGQAQVVSPPVPVTPYNALGMSAAFEAGALGSPASRMGYAPFGAPTNGRSWQTEADRDVPTGHYQQRAPTYSVTGPYIGGYPFPGQFGYANVSNPRDSLSAVSRSPQLSATMTSYPAPIGTPISSRRTGS